MFQQFLESFHNVAFLITGGAKDNDRSFDLVLNCSYCRYVSCRTVTDTLPPCFKEKRNDEKSLRVIKVYLEITVS